MGVEHLVFYVLCFISLKHTLHYVLYKVTITYSWFISNIYDKKFNIANYFNYSASTLDLIAVTVTDIVRVIISILTLLFLY